MTTPLCFFILGGPGSGKGTHCSKLVDEFGMTHYSAGDLLRAEGKKDSSLAAKIREIQNAGNIVPSEITVELLRNAINGAPNPAGFLIDGFPRKFDQAEMFEVGIAKAKVILYFDCSEQTMEKRLLGRRAADGSGRVDDDPEIIRKRFNVNVEQCIPVVEMYKKEGRAVVIDSNRTIDEVYADVRKIFIDLGCKPKQ